MKTILSWKPYYHGNHIINNHAVGKTELETEVGNNFVAGGRFSFQFRPFWTLFKSLFCSHNHYSNIV